MFPHQLETLIFLRQDNSFATASIPERNARLRVELKKRKDVPVDDDKKTGASDDWVWVKPTSKEEKES